MEYTKGHTKSPSSATMDTGGKYTSTHRSRARLESELFRQQVPQNNPLLEILLGRWRWSYHLYAFFFSLTLTFQGSSCGSAGKESACNAGHLGSIPELRRFPGEAKDNPLWYSGLENSMDCIVHGAAKSRTRQQLSLLLVTQMVKSLPAMSETQV